MNDMTIRMTPGGRATFYGDFKVCDDEGPSIFEAVPAGTVLQFTDIENRQADRGGHFLLGEGLVRLQNWSAGDLHRDMNGWNNAGLILKAPGYESWNLVIKVADDGHHQMYLVPEPATMVLLGFGALALIRKRR